MIQMRQTNDLVKINPLQKKHKEVRPQNLALIGGNATINQ